MALVVVPLAVAPATSPTVSSAQEDWGNKGRLKNSSAYSLSPLFSLTPYRFLTAWALATAASSMVE